MDGNNDIKIEENKGEDMKEEGKFKIS